MSETKNQTVKRTVELTLTGEFLDKFQLDAEFEKAIGYLSHWAIAGNSMSVVRISSDRDGNLGALYFNSAGEFKYEIGTVRHDDGKYSFHS